MEYITSYTLCQIRKDRLEKALELGLIVRSGNDFMLTWKAMTRFENAFSWINGNESWDGTQFVDRLIPRKVTQSDVNKAFED